jgi:hypothetical protein
MLPASRALVVLAHGMDGSKSDWDNLIARILHQTSNLPNYVIHAAASYPGLETHVGINELGRRLAAEVDQVINDRFDVADPPPPSTRKKPKEIVRLVLIGHSMGGLVCRAALPFLWDRNAVRPLRPNVVFESFITISTPHLGSRRPRGESTGAGLWRTVTHAVMGHAMGQSGRELMFADSDSDPSRCLLRRMAVESDYFLPLMAFNSRTLIGLVADDMQVPAAAALIHCAAPQECSLAVGLVPVLIGIGGFTHSGSSSADTSACEHITSHLSFPPNVSDLDLTLEFEDGPNAPRPCAGDSGFACDASSEVLFPLDVWQQLSRIPWRRIQLRLPPNSTLSFGAIKPVGHISVIGKVMPMMGVSAREEAFMELIIRLIDLDTKPTGDTFAPAAVAQKARACLIIAAETIHSNAVSQVTIRDGSRANMEQLHDGLGLGDKRISVLREDASMSIGTEVLQGHGREDAAVSSLVLPQRSKAGGDCAPAAVVLREDASICRDDETEAEGEQQQDDVEEKQDIGEADA